MFSSAHNNQNLDRRLSSHSNVSRCRQAFLLLIVVAGCGCLGCTDGTKGINANSSAASTPRQDANANSASSVTVPAAAVEITEPDRYSSAITISAQAASDTPTSMVTQQFNFARFDADRRWDFVLPEPIGQTTYLEKSGLRYLVFLERKQYVELSEDALGFQPATTLTAGAMAEHLKERVRYEQLGVELVNGRPAIKYRLAASGDASNQVDGAIFVDQEIRLPLRAEVNVSAQGGAKSRVIFEVRDVRLNPDRAQFDVPGGMKKVTPQEAKQEIEGCAKALRYFVDVLSGAQPASTARPILPMANKNAGGRTR
ncbi:MAG: hypothetical protein WAV47_14670 [Blastocatellia bacterium]